MTYFLKSPIKSIAVSSILALTFVIAGCNSNDDDMMSDLTQISSELSGKQEVPAIVGSTASGTSSVFLDEATGDISGYVEGRDLSGAIAAAHIHEAKAGQNGGPIVTLMQDADNLNRFNIPDNTQLTTEQLASLQQGGMYFNVHTADNTSGEIRGQIAPAGFNLVVSQLSGMNEVPAVTSDASGTAYISYNSDSAVVSINVVTAGVVATGAHLHQAAAGSNGGVIVGLVQDADSIALWSGMAELTAEQFTAFEAGSTYINVHSADNMAGEIRGQVMPMEATESTTMMTSN